MRITPIKVATAAVDTNWSASAKNPRRIIAIPPAMDQPREMGGMGN